MKIEQLFGTINPYEPKLIPPYIIAEAGVNHEGSMDIAKRLVDEAKEGGADAIKFQTYKADTLASKDSPAYWDMTKEPTPTQHQLFSRHDKFWKNEMVALRRYCDAADIEFMSTPFDIESANFLNDLMDVYKISSSDITNKPFIQHICGFGKPLIVSTGASNLWEIQEALSWIEPFGVPTALLHCILNYPTSDEDANLGMIVGLKHAFPGKLVGYSDHTLPKGMRICEIATLLGSVIIEKHFTHDKTLPGNDHYHAMDMDDLKTFRENLKWLFTTLGDFSVSALPGEEIARRNARRSLVAVHDIPEGKEIESSDLTFKRPAHGISPRNIDELIGKIARVAISSDTVLQWDMFK